MLAHNLELIHDNSLGRTSFADFWLLAMLENNPASHAGAMGVFYVYLIYQDGVFPVRG
jgi:hypothetical protein